VNTVTDSQSEQDFSSLPPRCNTESMKEVKCMTRPRIISLGLSGSDQ